VAIIYNPFLQKILSVHDNISENSVYPFFDPTCRLYEALREVMIDQKPLISVLDKFAISNYQYKQANSAFKKGGVVSLIGLAFDELIKPFPSDAERMIFVLKKARPWIPATKMVIILKGFDHDIDLITMRHLYASYGWAQGTKPYQQVDFELMNRRVIQLNSIRGHSLATSNNFLNPNDKLQAFLEIFRDIDKRGVLKRYPGSRVTFGKHKKSFLTLGLLGLVEPSPPPFRNSKIGFKEEGWMIISKIQHLYRTEKEYQKILKTKGINVDTSSIDKIFKKWDVFNFISHFKGNLQRFIDPELESGSDLESEEQQAEKNNIPTTNETKESSIRMDTGFIDYIKQLNNNEIPLANPGAFIILPLIHRLKIFDLTKKVVDIDPEQGYSWFSLLLLNIARIMGGISSISKLCRTNELSYPLCSGLVNTPSKDTLLNGLAKISEEQLLQMRQKLTQVIYENKMIKGRSIALDFHMRDFTGDDVELKNIGKGPSPKQKICFPGFRPHIAWDLTTNAPISLEFRHGTARATTTFKRFITELLPENIRGGDIEHIYLDSEYTAQKVWHFIVDKKDGLNADLTMCIKQNKAVKKHINTFLETGFDWLYFNDAYTYSNATFDIPINSTNKVLHCVLKRHEKTGRLRCFGSTLPGLSSNEILKEYKKRWLIENGIKDLVGNYFFDNTPGIDPHRINIHYFVVTISRLLFNMFCELYPDSKNSDNSQKGIGTIRPEFLTGTNTTLKRKGNQLILTWQDAYPEKEHKKLTAFFEALNETSGESLPFLGGLQLKFQISPPREREFCNQQKRVMVEFG
jgi:hypothetical protein